MTKGADTFSSDESNENSFDLKELVWTIGYRLTAYIGGTNIQTVKSWLQNGLPANLEARMRVTLDVAKPIADVESELIAQGFLIQEQDDLEPFRFPATMLRDADVAIARDALMQRAKKEFLDNVAGDLGAVAQRLRKWITLTKMPHNTAYSIHLSQDRLSLSLLHTGFSPERQRQWDRGRDWPFWAELVAEVPEMASARTCMNIESGCPFRYLRGSAK